MPVRLINLTPHDITIKKPAGRTVMILPSQGIARVELITEEAMREDTLRFCTERYGLVEGLPPPQKDVLYIVSRMVCDAMPNRDDIMFPMGLHRNGRGVVTGCSGFSIPKSRRNHR